MGLSWHPRRANVGQRRGPVDGRQSVMPLAATNVMTAGYVYKRPDAVHLGRKEGFSPGPANGPPSPAGVS
jgi:hypothetical protein